MSFFLSKINPKSVIKGLKPLQLSYPPCRTLKVSQSRVMKVEATGRIENKADMKYVRGHLKYKKRRREVLYRDKASSNEAFGPRTQAKYTLSINDTLVLNEWGIWGSPEVQEGCRARKRVLCPYATHTIAFCTHKTSTSFNLKQTPDTRQAQGRVEVVVKSILNAFAHP
ncbi:hypothetical protein GALMADRAFT_254907 [Galerina marginata CBS 339.88]|uniref:Uncharacterized protein n=1 Tax=Galerina marginata (strain CBS 339.88) TaxID=685588 RepID=A0A067SKH6_GALM3|nr:hypothetical protein GALMADRAFT_254907 [Galerina marginata CBS 339.88]